MAKIKYFDRKLLDKFGRTLSMGDKCLRVTLKKNSWKPKINIVEVQDITRFKIKIGERRYVDPENLVLLSTEGL